MRTITGEPVTLPKVRTSIFNSCSEIGILRHVEVKYIPWRLTLDIRMRVEGCRLTAASLVVGPGN